MSRTFSAISQYFFLFNHDSQALTHRDDTCLQLENQKKMKQVSYRLAFASFMIGVIPVCFFLKIPEMP